jgi:hypothetical protein
MSQFTNPLDHVRIAAPCSADWDTMFGDERVRFCAQCKLNVFNLSEMTKAEAEVLIARAEDRLCIRYYRRRDGSIMTQNCPVGLRAIKRKLSRVASAIGSALVTFFAGLGVWGVVDRGGLGPRYTAGAMVVDPLPRTVVEPATTINVKPAEMGMYPIVETGRVVFTKKPNRKHR